MKSLFFNSKINIVFYFVFFIHFHLFVLHLNQWFQLFIHSPDERVVWTQCRPNISIRVIALYNTIHNNSSTQMYKHLFCFHLEKFEHIFFIIISLQIMKVSVVFLQPPWSMLNKRYNAADKKKMIVTWLKMTQHLVILVIWL